MEALVILHRSMAWTMPVALFFAGIACLLLVMTGLQFVWPTIERRGFLPMTTTRGDRVFIGLLGAAWLHLVWLALVPAPLWWASILALLWFALVLRFG